MEAKVIHISCPVCSGEAILIHTNGVGECLTCHHLFVPIRLKEVYNGPAYQSKVTFIEDERR